jgi:acetoin utilization protein AcuB
MKVKHWMRKKLIVCSKDDTILDALHMMKENDIRRLPVVDGYKLLGIITEKDIKDFSPSKASTLDIYEMHNVLAKSTVSDAMNSEVVSVMPEDPIEKAALILKESRFGGLPVVNENSELVGIITAVDIFDIFAESMGFAYSSTRIAIELLDRKGALAEMTSIMKEYDVNIISLATFFFKDRPKNSRDVVMRVNGDKENIQKAIEKLQSLGFEFGSIMESD